MQSILDAINEWIKEILIGAINGNLSTMFGDVNEKVGTIAAEVGQTPQGWNANIFSMIQTLSENVIVPIAGLVITYVLCYELISMVTEKNNMHDVDTSMFFKWVFKAFVAVYLVTHTFDIMRSFTRQGIRRNVPSAARSLRQPLTVSNTAPSAGNVSPADKPPSA